MIERSAPQAIAIVGLAGRFPGAQDLDAFWQNIRNGVESLEILSDDDLDAAGALPLARANPHYVRKGTPLGNADHFDAAFFGYSPREAQIIDPQQRVFLECAWEAVEHAGYAGHLSDRTVGVYAGAGMPSYLMRNIMRDWAFAAAVGRYQVMIGNDKDFLCTRVAYELNLHGPAMSVQTACSTSLVAVQAACRALQRGECDMALAGGVSISFPERAGYLYEEGMIFSPDGHCRPFDSRAQGTRGSNGAGVVVLKRLAEAVKDGDTIHAVILGAAVNNDGSGKAGFTAPSIEGQAEVIRMALQEASVDPRTIEYVEAHGTATPLGDPIEIAALTRAYRASTADVGFCRIGSLKANLGHLDAAAGVASLIKTVLALRNRELPPLVHFESPNPQLDLERSPFMASATAAAWTAEGHVRRAGVSSFGIGGTNAHVVLEEAPAATPGIARRNMRLLVLSAKTPTALDSATTRLADYLRAPRAADIADVAYTLQLGRQALSERRAVVVRDAEHAADVLADPLNPAIITGSHEGATRPVAFLFSGQGSQHTGMGAALYKNEPAYRAAFDRCAEILKPHLGLDIRDVVFGGPAREEELNRTGLSQPALFAVEYSLSRLWNEWGVVPEAMLGHSIGEYVAAHLSSVLSLEDALMLVAARGRLMQALPSGAMLAIHLSPEQVTDWLMDGVELAAVNAPAMCAVSGPREKVDALAAKLEAAGIEHRALHTSHAFHSAMMEPAVEPFQKLVAGVKLSPPVIPYLSNVTGTWITPEQAMSPAYYGTHLRQAVQFESGVRTLAGALPATLLEVGPGNALSTLARLSLGRTGAKRIASSLPHPREQRDEVESMLEAAGRLWVSGADIGWQGLHTGEQLHRVPLPTYPFERKQFRVEPKDNLNMLGAAFATRNNDVDDWFQSLSWRRDSARGKSVELGDTWLVLAEPGDLAEAVGNQLGDAGALPLFVRSGDRAAWVDKTHYMLRPDSREDFETLARELATGGRRVGGVLHLWCIPEGPDQAADDKRLRVMAYDSVLALVSSLRGVSPEHPLPLFIATAGWQSVLDEPSRRPMSALVSGPVIVLPNEIPGLQTRSIDFDLEARGGSARAMSQALVTEAKLRDGESFVAWRAGRRWVRRPETLRLPTLAQSPPPLRTKGVYLVLGGLGGMGLAFARRMAQQPGIRLVLTSRKGLPSRQEWDALIAANPQGDRITDAIMAIREMEAAGADVLPIANDVANEAAVRSLVDEARRRWGRIDGVVHAAGVASAGIALLQSREEIDGAFSAKADGLAVLVKVLGDTPLDFVSLSSSMNSFMGGDGVCSYCSANAHLDAFAESSRKPAGWRCVTAIDWWAWKETGMATRVQVPEAQRAAREAFLREAMTTPDAVDAFMRTLGSNLPRVVVVPFDLSHPSFRRHTGSPRPDVAVGTRAEVPAAAADNQPRPELSSSFEGPANTTEERLARIWGELLGVDRIGVHDNFFELGGHSLVATRVLSRVEGEFAVRLPLRSAFEAPTIRQFAELILNTEALLAPVADDAAGGERDQIEF